jgi:hypothetical protein
VKTMKRIAYLATMLMVITTGEAQSEPPVVANSPDGRSTAYTIETHSGVVSFVNNAG